MVPGKQEGVEGGGGALRDIVCKKIQGGDIKEVVRANNRID